MAATLVEAERTGPGFDGDASPEKAHGDEPEQPQDGEQDAEEKVDHKDGDGGSDSDDEPPSYRVAVRVGRWQRGGEGGSVGEAGALTGRRWGTLERMDVDVARTGVVQLVPHRGRA